MATLKNTDREEVMRRALSDAFAPRFAAIRTRLQELLRQHLTADHSQFVKLAKDPETRRYLALQNVRNFYFVDGEQSHKAAAPKYGKWGELPTTGYLDRECYESMQDSDTAVPYFMTEYKATDRKLLKEYTAAWRDYGAAFDKLRALLNSYTTREKFVADFPEFDKYLPPIVTKARLPAVVVPQVRAELSALGIPQN